MNPIDQIRDLFSQRGHLAYGEGVTELQHALHVDEGDLPESRGSISGWVCHLSADTALELLPACADHVRPQLQARRLRAYPVQVWVQLYLFNAEWILCQLNYAIPTSF